MKGFSNYFFSCFLIIPFLFSIIADSRTSGPDSFVFPVPPKTENSLFYLQRTINSNTVVYEINRNKNGEINLNEPVKIQWIRYASDSTFEPLNYIQRTFAYGLETKLIDSVKKSFVIHFVSYKEKPLFLLKSPHDNNYHVFVHINNKLSVLEKVYVKIDGGTLWLPEIQYVEITGKSPATSEIVSEKIRP